MQSTVAAPHLQVEAPKAAAPARRPVSVGTQVFEFLIVGGATFLAFPLAWLFQRALGVDQALGDVTVYHFSFIAAYAAYVINDPHFAVTYMLFYRKVGERAFGPTFTGWQRARYWFAGLVVPLLLAAWAIYAIEAKSPAAMGWMIQAMYLAVGWHYVKQGFGVLSVLSARRGIRFGGWERFIILGHCYLGWGYGWSKPLMLGGWMQTDGITYQAYALGVPTVWLFWAGFVVSGLAVLVALGVKLFREGTLPIVPIVGLLTSIWMWVVLPDLNPVVGYAIPALHSIQYLYFVSLLKRGEAQSQAAEGIPWGTVGLRLALFAGTTLALGWMLFHAPEIADKRLGTAAWGVGATPLLAAISTFVNIHHYFMDNCIWRRENPETRHMMR